MVVQDPPIALDNSKPEKFDTTKYRGYQHNGLYTAYVVWPAITLYKEGPMLSKGVAEGKKLLQVPKQSKLTGERTTTIEDRVIPDARNQTLHPSITNVRNQSKTNTYTLTEQLACTNKVIVI